MISCYNILAAFVIRLSERLEISLDVILGGLGLTDGPAGLGTSGKLGPRVGGKRSPMTPRSVRVLRARSAQPALAAGLAGLGWTRNLT